MGSRGPQAAIAGLGITEMTRHYTGPGVVLAADAINLALEDSGLKKDEIDGLFTNAGITGSQPDSVGLQLQTVMGLRNLKLMNHMNAAGSTAGQMIQFAALAIDFGMAEAVACVFADAPLATGQSSGSIYGAAAGRAKGLGALASGAAYGMMGANAAYALAARRHMATYGTTHDQLGAIAVSNRKWAGLNPRAVFRTPITIEDYHNSRWICEPFHLLDCTMVNNGAIAVIVTSRARAKSLKQPPIYIAGMGQGHPGNPRRAGFENEMNTGAQIAGKTAFAMAGLTPADVDVCELYDCYTYTTLVTIEDYGFCKKGEGGSFVEGGRLEPGGALPTNTGGGELSGYYMWGMTPVSEGIIQARGQGGERQVPKHDVVLVSAQGGLLDYHSALILTRHETLN